MKMLLMLLVLSLTTSSSKIYAADQLPVSRHISKAGFEVDIPNADWLVPAKDSPITNEPRLLLMNGLAFVEIERLPGIIEDRLNHDLNHIHDSTIHQTDLKKEPLSQLDSIKGNGFRYIVTIIGDANFDNRQEGVLFTPKGSLSGCRIFTLIVGKPTQRTREEISSILASLKVGSFS